MSFPSLLLKRLAGTAGIAALLVFAASAPGAAQIYYPPAYVGPDGAVKFDVKPKEALVYVDGFYAGIVDDFNGTFQRLYVAPGGHEITLFLQGYRTHSERAYLAPDRTFKIKYQMEKLPAGEVSERPPTAVLPQRTGQPPFGPRSPGGRGQQPRPNAPGPDNAPPGESAPRSGEHGTLELTLQPADAEVLIDGQSWPRSGADRVTMDLSEGHHNIQVRKAGYVGYLSDFDVRAGETTTLSVNLRSQTAR